VYQFFFIFKSHYHNPSVIRSDGDATGGNPIYHHRFSSTDGKTVGDELFVVLVDSVKLE
jgi:hypothetical protein